MNKEIYLKIANAEDEWESKIKEVFNELLKKYKNDYKKIAELFLVIEDRKIELIFDDKFRFMYQDLECEILDCAQKLSESDYEEFRNLADLQCMVCEEFNPGKEKLKILCENYSKIKDPELKEELLDSYTRNKDFWYFMKELKEITKKIRK